MDIPTLQPGVCQVTPIASGLVTTRGEQMVAVASAQLAGGPRRRPSDRGVDLRRAGLRCQSFRQAVPGPEAQDARVCRGGNTRVHSVYRLSGLTYWVGDTEAEVFNYAANWLEARF